jgi:hypothetical protein
MALLRIFRVEPDRARFGAFRYRLVGDVPSIERSAQRRVVYSSWRAPLLAVDGGGPPRPDLWPIEHTQLFALSPRTADALTPYVAMAGELLPVHTTEPGADLLALHVKVVDALARERLPKLAFLGHRLGEPTLFCVPQLPAVVFCLERDDVDDSFMRRMEAHELSGLVFVHVWSSGVEHQRSP